MATAYINISVHPTSIVASEISDTPVGKEAYRVTGANIIICVTWSPLVKRTHAMRGAVDNAACNAAENAGFRASHVQRIETRSRRKPKRENDPRDHMDRLF